jgi:hypothetical protein
MSVHNAQSARNAHSAHQARGRTAARLRVLDRLFLGGCIATYVVLMGAVVVALKAYGT